MDSSDVTLARVTTGRSELWGSYWNGEPMHAFRPRLGLHVVSDFDRDIRFRGCNSARREAASSIPHNDFLFLFMELGILGFGLLVVFWLDLLRRIRLLSRSRSEWIRYEVEFSFQ